MYIIAGLGNPTREYEKTRHNVGFDAVDRLAEQYGISLDGKKHKAVYGKGRIEGAACLLAKPQTYMNLSGESITELIKYYKCVPESELIVLYDDISLPPGQLRIRTKGSAGGHNGIKSIISQLGTQEFMRIKIGVGEKPKGWDLADYVLGRFSKEDRGYIERALDHVAAAAAMLMTQGPAAAMNEYNKRVTYEGL